MRSPAALLAPAVALALTPSALAKTIPLGWTEVTSPAYGYPAMTFKVKDVVITARAWSVQASITNRSKYTIKVVPPHYECCPHYWYGFSLVWPPKCVYPAVSCRLEEARSTYARPPIPKTFAPGQKWTGVFGSPKLPPLGKIINVSFGEFYVPHVKDFSWITTHAFKL